MLLKKLRQSQIQKESNVQKVKPIGRNLLYLLLLLFFLKRMRIHFLRVMLHCVHVQLGGAAATPPPLVRGSITSSKGPLQVAAPRSGRSRVTGLSCSVLNVKTLCCVHR